MRATAGGPRGRLLLLLLFHRREAPPLAAFLVRHPRDTYLAGEDGARGPKANKLAALDPLLQPAEEMQAMGRPAGEEAQEAANTHDLLVAVPGPPMHADALHVRLIHVQVVDMQVNGRKVLEKMDLFFESFFLFSNLKTCVQKISVLCPVFFSILNFQKKIRVQKFAEKFSGTFGGHPGLWARLGEGGGRTWPSALLAFANNAAMPTRNRPSGVLASFRRRRPHAGTATSTAGESPSCLGVCHSTGVAAPDHIGHCPYTRPTLARSSTCGGGTPLCSVHAGPSGGSNTCTRLY